MRHFESILHPIPLPSVHFSGQKTVVAPLKNWLSRFINSKSKSIFKGRYKKKHESLVITDSPRVIGFTNRGWSSRWGVANHCAQVSPQCVKIASHSTNLVTNIDQCFKTPFFIFFGVSVLPSNKTRIFHSRTL